MPFDAMKGLQEALQDRRERHSRVAKHDVSEDDAEAINIALLKLEKGTQVRVRYYKSFHEAEKTGTVSEVNTVYKFIVADDEKIFFDEIYFIDIIP